MKQSMAQQRTTIVTKIGTEALSDAQGEPDLMILAPLVKQLAALKKEGKAVVHVTSGAVGVGRRILGWGDKELMLHERQVASEFGQPVLMGIYDDLFKVHGINVSQTLFERRHFGYGDQSPIQAVAAPFFLKLAMPHAVSIVNENDGVATTELRFTDNDQLAKHVARLARAQTLIILTNVEGVYTTNPSDPAAKKINTINFCDPASWQGIDTSGASSKGLGGMKNKIKSAHCFLCGREGERLCEPAPWAHWEREVFIASSRTPNVITRLLAGEEGVGTRLVCRPQAYKVGAGCFVNRAKTNG